MSTLNPSERLTLVYDRYVQAIQSASPALLHAIADMRYVDSLLERFRIAMSLLRAQQISSTHAILPPSPLLDSIEQNWNQRVALVKDALPIDGLDLAVELDGEHTVISLIF